MNPLTTTGKNPRNTAKKPKDTPGDTSGEYQAPESIEAVQELLRSQVYISDRALAVPIFLAMKLQRPLFLEGEAGVGYVMRAGYDLPPLMFTQDEIVALVAGARLIRAWGGMAMAAAAEEALVKINAVMPDGARDRAERVQVHAIDFSGMSEEVRARLDLVEGAINGRVLLETDYEDEERRQSRRVLRPLGLYFWGKVWTLVAWCELREDFRSFRIDRFSRIVEGGRFREERGRTLKDYYDMQAARGFLRDGSCQ